MIAAPASGAGKTTITLALLRLLSRNGIAVRGAKSGPDYIDPQYHAAACGAPCPNLDAWAMTPARLRALAAAYNGGRDGDGDALLIVEAAMGLFDGAPPDGRGSAADLARALAVPVILVVDAARMAQSIAPLVAGFAGHDRHVRVVGVILNRTGSARHEATLRRALAPLGLPVLAALRRDAALARPARHLGLVQAGEQADLDAFLDRAATALEQSLDLDALRGLASPLAPPPAAGAPSGPQRFAPPAQIIAIARDAAFGFAYPHLLDDWRSAGAELRFFSPLADESVPEADFIFLPGGYPELHADRLAAAETFRRGMKVAAQKADIYGECGGYMVLGECLVDAHGTAHEMLGLLPLSTSFAEPRLHLGYRMLTALNGPLNGRFAGHEFHYARTLQSRAAPPLFSARDAEGAALPDMGLVCGRVAGSFAHVIDAA